MQEPITRIRNRDAQAILPFMIESAIHWLLAVLAVPTVGLPAVFVVSFVSATLVPMGSEPAVFAVAKANDALFWSVILVATVGNTAGGAVDYWMGHYAKQTFAKEAGQPLVPLAIALRRQDHAVVVAAGYRRPTLHARRMARIAVLAERVLYGGRKICALSDDYRVAVARAGWLLAGGGELAELNID